MCRWLGTSNEKKYNLKTKKYFMKKGKFNFMTWMLAGTMALTFTACDDEDDDDDNIFEDDQTELEMFDQDVSQNMIMVSSAEVPEGGGWVVIHRDNGNGGPQVPEIISEPYYLSEGETEDFAVKINSDYDLTGGETLWAMLHEDDGDQQYEFNGEGTPDQPFMDEGEIVMENFSIGGPYLDVSAAVYDSAAHEVYIPEVNTAVEGWLVIHNEEMGGGITLPGIIGKVEVDEGVNENVAIELDDNVTITDGQKLYPMLHIDNGEEGEYEFDGSADSNDPPEVFGHNEDGTPKIIVKSFDVAL